MTAWLASPLGLVVGLVLGALGGGGSVLAIPALVYGAGQNFQAATTASLVIVGVMAVAGAVRHHRLGNVELRAGALFGAAGALGAVGGTYLNRSLDQGLLKVAFAVLMLVVAVRMLRSDAGDVDDESHERTDAWWRVAVAGSAVGLLTGLFGVGGGFVIVPALVLFLGYRMPIAVGTSLVIIAINAAVALGARAGSLASLDWRVVAPFTVLGLVGVWLGGRVADRFGSARLTTAFGVLLVLVALYTGYDGATALASA